MAGISNTLIKILKKLASLKREATIREVAESLEVKKVHVKSAVKNSPLVKVAIVEPHGAKKAEVYLSLTDAGIDFLVKYTVQSRRVRGKQ